MSDQPGAGAFVDDVFASVLGALAPDDAPEAAGAPAAAEGAAAGEGAPAAAGVPAAAGEPGAAADAGAGGAPADGAGAPAAGGAGPTGAAVTGGDPAAAGGDAGSAGGDPAATGVDYAVVAADLTGLSQKFEEHTQAAFQGTALEAVQTEFKSYFDTLRQHPRMLVGTEVPSLTGPEGTMETLRDADDAREWQEAVKVLLTEEVRERTTKAMEENQGILNTVSQSIELFVNNKDLVPGTRQFDRQLADRFSSMVKPYELRVDGKLHGFTIPVQPLIDSLRASLVAERAAARPAAPAAAAAAPATPGAPAARPAEQPQAGIGSKAGSAGGEGEDFSTLFGTLGLPNLRI